MTIVPEERNAEEQIDAIINSTLGWRGVMLADLRAIILSADSNIIEEVKWKKPSRPSGVPVWSFNGIVCVADILKSAVRLTFPKGAQFKDPSKIFNTRLSSKSVRAIDYFENEVIDDKALNAIISYAVLLNYK